MNRLSKRKVGARRWRVMEGGRGGRVRFYLLIRQHAHVENGLLSCAHTGKRLSPIKCATNNVWMN